MTPFLRVCWAIARQAVHIFMRGFEGRHGSASLWFADKLLTVECTCGRRFWTRAEMTETWLTWVREFSAREKARADADRR